MSTSMKLTEEWQQAEQAVQRRRRELGDAEARLAEKVKALAQHILPSDAKDSEAIALWVRTGRKTERIVEARRYRATLSDEWGYRVHFRGEERPLEGLEELERDAPTGATP